MSPTLPPARLLIVEDSPFIGEALIQLVGLMPQIAVVGQVFSASETLEWAHRHAPTIVSLDLRIQHIPGGAPHPDHGIAALRQLLALTTPPAVLVVTSLPEQPWLRVAANAGAVGFVSKDGSSDSIVAALQAVAAKMSAFTPSQLQILREMRPLLSPRECEVLGLLAEGLGNQDIADRLSISSGTVRKHIENLFTALDVHSRGQAVVVARRDGLIDT